MIDLPPSSPLGLTVSVVNGQVEVPAGGQSEGVCCIERSRRQAAGNRPVGVSGPSHGGMDESGKIVVKAMAGGIGVCVTAPGPPRVRKIYGVDQVRSLNATAPQTSLRPANPSPASRPARRRPRIRPGCLTCTGIRHPQAPATPPFVESSIRTHDQRGVDNRPPCASRRGRPSGRHDRAIGSVGR